jgi:hypothetical protein
VAAALAAVLVSSAQTAEIDGAWIAKVEGREGRSMEFKFQFTAHGEKLTGAISSPMGGEAAISEGKIKGDKLTFEVAREFQGRSMVMHYEGKLKGDEIQFRQSVEGMDRPPREFTAKRAQ